MKKIITGIQPTNDLTLGNYLGSINVLKEYSLENELYLFVADLHSISLGKFNPNELNIFKNNIIKYYIAAGLDLDNVFLFNQSSIKAIPCLSHIMSCATTIGELSRMTQFKDKSQKQSNGTTMIPTGLLTYPALMAADILIYDVDFVIVGSDQKQHLELTRNLAQRLNKTLKHDIFKIPEYLCSKTSSRIMDLQNPSIKMSKSNIDKKGVIFINDDINISLNKIKTAKTDSLNNVKYDPINQPGISNLISIYSGLTKKDFIQIEEEFKGKNYGDFKKSIIEVLENFLIDFQSRFRNISEEQVNNILKKGFNKANDLANAKLEQIYSLIGFSYGK